MFNNISFIGMAGCGKSTIGKALSSKLSLSFVDTDLLIEARFNQSLESIKKSNGPLQILGTPSRISGIGRCH